MGTHRDQEVLAVLVVVVLAAIRDDDVVGPLQDGRRLGGLGRVAVDGGVCMCSS